MKLLLIGVGYVGNKLLNSWQGCKDSFTATTTTPSKITEIESSKLVEKALLLDIKTSANVLEVSDSCDAIILTVAPKKESNYQETYLNIALSIKEALKKINRPIFLLYTSSTSVYGSCEGKVVAETTPLKATSENGKALVKAEEILLSCNSDDVKVCILRLGGIYGPGRTLENRLKRMVNKNLSGTGQELTNHIHLDDITGAIEFCITKRIAGVFNLVNDDHPSRQELYVGLAQKMKLSEPKFGGPSPTCHLTNAIVSNEKIKSLGYQFKHPHLPDFSEA